MLNFNYKNIESFCKTTNEVFDYTKRVSIVALYDEIVDIMNTMVKDHDFSIRNVEILEPEMDCYEDAYILTIDEDRNIWCQKARYEEKENYINCVDGYPVLVNGKVNAKFLADNISYEEDEMFMFEFNIVDREANDSFFQF